LFLRYISSKISCDRKEIVGGDSRPQNFFALLANQDFGNVQTSQYRLCVVSTLVKTSERKRLGKSIQKLSLEQFYPAPVQKTNLNVCGDPDCGNYGVAFDPIHTTFRGRDAAQKRLTASLANPAVGLGRGRYRLNSSGDEDTLRVSSLLEYAKNDHYWDDDRTMKCQHQSGNSECGIQLSVLSNKHFDDELERLLSNNGLLTGPACGNCGMTYLSKPSEFAFNGANGKKSAGNGNKKATGIRLVHKPCRGKKGARFTVSLNHVRQIDRQDNITILKHLVNDTSINGLRRLISSGNRQASVKMIYDRIFWLEKTLLAYEKAQVEQWKKRVSKSGTIRHTRIAHDDIVLGVNWETSHDRRITALNCAVSADIQSGYVFRVDADFDPTVDPVAFISETYLGEGGKTPSLRQNYTQKGGSEFTAPMMHFQRPSGRYDEPALFASAESQLRLFAEKIADATSRDPSSQTDQVEWAIHEAHEKADQIALLGDYYFNFRESERDSRNSFSGIMTRDTYTKAAHLAALRELIPSGKITLIGEQESAMARTVPHIFRDLIKKDDFEWHVIHFNKQASKPSRQSRFTAYDKAFRQFRAKHPDLEIWEALEIWTARNLTPAVKSDRHGRPKPFPISNFASKAFPALWIRSPIQASGETDKTVGFPILSSRYRTAYKKLGIQDDITDVKMKAAISRRVIQATIQPASTFMNSLRERVSFAKRSGGRASRTGDTFVNGASYNPRVLIAILNIYRVYYNFFELRTYVSPINKHDETEYVQRGTTSIAMPGSDERITVPKRRRLAPVKRTPAMRAGIQAGPIGDGDPKLPDLTKVLYQPWLFYGTPLWSKLQGRQIEKS
jgi:hypothetical protein